ncbi:50s ribosomal protein l35 [Quercus suber]|uniref:50S ribosomal protein L35 n=1 Tax=Quercus suber TaxID=58331 RepID=A0AAW0JNV8_QUESU
MPSFFFFDSFLSRLNQARFIQQEVELTQTQFLKFHFWASAKRFRVTGRGKIVRRGAGKQHLLYKKNNKRKLRLSKMQAVSRSDYDNVIGALPYLKVNRKAK